MGILTYKPRDIVPQEAEQLVADALERVYLGGTPFVAVGASNKVKRQCIETLAIDYPARLSMVTKTGEGYKCHVVTHGPLWGSYYTYFANTDYIFDVEDENTLLMLKLILG